MSVYQTLPDPKSRTYQRLFRPLRPYSYGDGRAHLRLLRLYSGCKTDPIECDLEISTYAKSRNKYEAISYCWGNAEDTVSLTCNGVQTLITRNLHNALQRFRPPRGAATRLLWADALCINQEDDAEKGEQVGRMGEVYSNASCVLVWLGSDVDDATAMNTFEMIREVNQYFDEALTRCRNVLYAMPALSDTHPICLEEEKWTGVAALLESPWFSRVWTIQEAALARECTVFWGNAEIDAVDIIELCLWCVHYRDLEHILEGFTEAPGAPKVVINLAIYKHYISNRWGSTKWFRKRPLSAQVTNHSEAGQWVSVLGRCAGLAATDARDHIYAFLGCPAAISDTAHPYLKADYTITKDELYKRVAETLLRVPKEGPWVICAVGSPIREDVMLRSTPSWVPCWDTSNGVISPSNPMFWYRAGGPEDLFHTERQGTTTLSVRGQLFDRVTWMSDIIDSIKFLDSRLQLNEPPYIDRLWEQVSTHMAGVGKVLQTKDFCLMLVRGFPSSLASWEPWHMGFIHTYLKSVGSKITIDMPQGDSTDVQLAARNVGYYLRPNHDYRIVVTLHGRVGVVPGLCTRLGDTLCIFHGVSVPFILAPITEGRFKLVGQAYIHGVMDGELVKQHEGQTILLE